MVNWLDYVEDLLGVKYTFVNGVETLRIVEGVLWVLDVLGRESLFLNVQLVLGLQFEVQVVVFYLGVGSTNQVLHRIWV